MTKANELLDTLKFAQENQGTVSYESITRALLAVIDEVEPLICYSDSVFNDTRFTDRHQMGPKFTKAIATIERAKEICHE